MQLKNQCSQWVQKYFPCCFFYISLFYRRHLLLVIIIESVYFYLYLNNKIVQTIILGEYWGCNIILTEPEIAEIEEFSLKFILEPSKINKGTNYPPMRDYLPTFSVATGFNTTHVTYLTTHKNKMICGFWRPILSVNPIKKDSALS